MLIIVADHFAGALSFLPVKQNKTKNRPVCIIIKIYIKIILIFSRICPGQSFEAVINSAFCPSTQNCVDKIADASLLAFETSAFEILYGGQLN